MLQRRNFQGQTWRHTGHTWSPGGAERGFRPRAQSQRSDSESYVAEMAALTGAEPRADDFQIFAAKVCDDAMPAYMTGASLPTNEGFYLLPLQHGCQERSKVSPQYQLSVKSCDVDILASCINSHSSYRKCPRELTFKVLQRGGH